jgi:hypothetical protein
MIQLESRSARIDKSLARMSKSAVIFFSIKVAL